MEEKYVERISKFIEKLPEPEKTRPIISIDGKLLNWKQILEEFKNDGVLKERILNKIKETIK
ncbi:MAG: hypothetical protein U1B79_00825 [Candidatus Pacearchaeota archaeon]|nr:hypothetical protein [Candidatus Pacearchaeota archaeon]